MIDAVAIPDGELRPGFVRHVVMKAPQHFHAESESQLAFPLLGRQTMMVKSRTIAYVSMVLPERRHTTLVLSMASYDFL